VAYLVPNDFRSATLNEVCKGLSLEVAAPDTVSDAALITAIARMSMRIDDWTNDHFEPQAGIETLDVPYESIFLYLPRRTTAVSQVQTQDPTGLLTTQAATSYRLLSSLDATGSNLREAQSSTDKLTIVPPPGNGLVVTLSTTPWVWPVGPATILVTGTFGWTVTPGDIKRALALIVYFHFKPLNNTLRMAETVNVADAAIRFGATVPSGIPEADDIIFDYKRDLAIYVG
jgi:hypothetical protein